MKSSAKILFRYVVSAAGIALLVLVVNIITIAVLGIWTRTLKTTGTQGYQIAQISNEIIARDTGYLVTDDGKSKIESYYDWAMLIDLQGNVVWQLNLPDGIPSNYTVGDIASFSRWYLEEYPVYSWQREDGLLVLGKPKGSMWKYWIQATDEELDKIPIALVLFFVFNAVFSTMLALFLGGRFFRGMKPLAEGIDKMSVNEIVDIPAKGLFKGLSSKINETSKQLYEQEIVLRKRDTARSNWIEAVSHDIRTPLSMVMGYANQLEESLDLPEEAKKHAKTIRLQSERIKSLIEDLNLTTKLEYDMQPLKKARINMPSLVRNVVAEMINSGIPDTYSIDILIAERANGAMVCADEKLIKRAIYNLIINSIKHNPNGCDIRVNLAVINDTCVLIVEDNGGGYPESVLRNTKDSENSNNQGMGLVIVRQIATSHGGNMKCSNLVDGGCSVRIELPLY